MRAFPVVAGLALAAFAVLQAPESPRSFAAAPASAVVPFTMVSDNMIFPIRINGVRSYAIFDTGGRFVMTPDLARRLNLRTAAKGSVGGMGAGRPAYSVATVHDVAIGDVTLHDQQFVVVPLPYDLTRGGPVPVDVDVGYELLSKYAARIDFKTREITLTENAAAQRPVGAAAVHLAFSDTTPMVTASIDGLSGRFLADTGSSFAVAFTAPFVAAHRMDSRYPATKTLVTGEGLGGNTYAKLVRTKLLRIGDAEVVRPVAQLSADTAGTLASASYAGVIGIDVLKCFTATFDYARSALYLAPRSPDCPQPFDRTGATVEKTDGNGYAVEGVLANGPAALAGLRA
ncbi:MAG TPA: pepsin/retropepsin-like aspartic protease family protein, partial [Candidatus Tumulicola sp.]|nr:pepsin/retropepsin-like aspartic protease family protein [Candidatus Tumulicola sp.]